MISGSDREPCRKAEPGRKDVANYLFQYLYFSGSILNL